MRLTWKCPHDTCSAYHFLKTRSWSLLLWQNLFWHRGNSKNPVSPISATSGTLHRTPSLPRPWRKEAKQRREGGPARAECLPGSGLRREWRVTSRVARGGGWPRRGEGHGVHLLRGPWHFAEGAVSPGEREGWGALNRGGQVTGLPAGAGLLTPSLVFHVEQHLGVGKAIAPGEGTVLGFDPAGPGVQRARLFAWLGLPVTFPSPLVSSIGVLPGPGVPGRRFRIGFGIQRYPVLLGQLPPPLRLVPRDSLGFGLQSLAVHEPWAAGGVSMDAGGFCAQFGAGLLFHRGIWSVLLFIGPAYKGTTRGTRTEFKDRSTFTALCSVPSRPWAHAAENPLLTQVPAAIATPWAAKQVRDPQWNALALQALQAAYRPPPLKLCSSLPAGRLWFISLSDFEFKMSRARPENEFRVL